MTEKIYRECTTQQYCVIIVVAIFICNYFFILFLNCYSAIWLSSRKCEANSVCTFYMQHDDFALDWRSIHRTPVLSTVSQYYTYIDRGVSILHLYRPTPVLSTVCPPDVPDLQVPFPAVLSHHAEPCFINHRLVLVRQRY